MKEDGEIVCYHVYELNRFMEYLYKSTKFESPSTSEDKENPGYYRYQKYINALANAYGDAKLIIVGEGVDGGNLYIGSLTQQPQQAQTEIEPTEPVTQE